jgi:hypothetical protein
VAHIGTVSLGRIGGIGDCLIADQVEGLCPDGSPYLGTLDSGGTAVEIPCLYGGGPLAPGQSYCAGAPTPTPTPTPTPVAPYVGLPLSIPPVIAPKGVTTVPGVGLSVPVTCPAGFVASGGICVAAPSTTLIPGVPNGIIYAGLGLLAIMAMTGGGKGRR